MRNSFSASGLHGFISDFNRRARNKSLGLSLDKELGVTQESVVRIKAMASDRRW
jgi:hypothetical protein